MEPRVADPWAKALATPGVEGTNNINGITVEVTSRRRGFLVKASWPWPLEDQGSKGLVIKALWPRFLEDK